MRKQPLIVTAVLAGVLTILSSQTASAAPGGIIPNGDFSADAIGSSTITGWTTVLDVVDLGVTSLAGCTTVDTSDYSSLRDIVSNQTGPLIVAVDSQQVALHPTTGVPLWVSANAQLVPPGTSNAWPLLYGTPTGGAIPDFFIFDGTTYHDATTDTSALDAPGASISTFVLDTVVPLFPEDVPDPLVRQDNVGPTGSAFWTRPNEFAVTVSDTAYDSTVRAYVPLGGQALRLESSVRSRTQRGYVMHGPAVVSDPFTVAGTRSISLDWYASAVNDDFHVFGYVVNTATCVQTEVLDATGYIQNWSTATATVSAPGTYRFVFVAGTYDQSWGRLAGSELLIDNIRSTPVLAGTVVDVDLDASSGTPAANAPASLTGAGLAPASAWSATLRSPSGSTPLTQGTADSNGAFFRLARLPAGLAPGRYSVELSGLRPDGSALADVLYFTVGADGTIAAISTTAPPPEIVPVSTPSGPAGTRRELADTGGESSLVTGAAAALLVLGGALLVMERRGRRVRDV